MIRPPGLALRYGALALLCALATPALAAESIVLMPLELTGGLEVNRADIESAVTKGLSAAGRPIIPPDETGARGTYVVNGTIGKEGSTFTARFRLGRMVDGHELGTQENHCDVADCSVAELARRSARELVRQNLERLEPPRPEAAPPKALAPPPETTSSRPTLLGAGAIALGAAAVGAGVYLVAIDGRCTSTVAMQTCKYENKTLAGGIASIAGGVAAGALGVYLLVHDGEQGSVAVGLHPSGITVAGRF